MKIKVITYQDVACSRCKEVDVKHHGKGMCVNCYQNKYWHANLSPKAPVDKVKKTVKKTK